MAIYLGKCKQGDLVQFRSPTIPTKEITRSSVYSGHRSIQEQGWRKLLCPLWKKQSAHPQRR